MAGIAAAVDSTIQGATRNRFTGVLDPFPAPVSSNWFDSRRTGR
jgi:hypothetical protein